MGCGARCGARCDSIEHYAQCSTVQAFFVSSGVNDYAPNIGNFLMIQQGLSPNHISLHARCIYAVYITRNIFASSEEPLIDVQRVRETLKAAFIRASNG